VGATPLYGLYLGDLDRASNQSHGIINYAIGLAGALSRALAGNERLVVYANDHIAAELDGIDPRATRIHRVQRPANGAHRLVLDSRVVWTARRAGVGVLHFPKGILPLSIPPRGPALVTTIHDDIPMQYADGRFTKNDARAGIRSRVIANLLQRSLRRSDCVITVSEHSRAALEARAQPGGRRREIRVIGQGSSLPAQAYVPKAERDPVLLHLASPLAHKRTAFVVDSTARYVADRAVDLRLVLVGSVPDGLRVGAGAELVPGPVARADLAERSARARALLFPSASEGYGLPPVEAWLSGTPSVYDSAPAITEMARPIPGRLSSGSYAAFASALDEVLALDDAALTETREAVAAVSSWPPVAGQVLDVYRAYSSTKRS
jgi:glycosyltransferase involved in cell wall biosynthesis